MQKFLQILAGLIVLALPLTAKAVTYVGSVTATSNAADIIGYAKPVIEPTFSTSEGSSVRILNDGYRWQKKDADGNWVKYTSSDLGDKTFTEGIYRLLVKVYTTSTEFVLADSWKLTVDGVEWTTKKPVNTSRISQAYAYSPEILVTAPIHIYGVVATSNYPDVIGYGKPMEYPDFTMAEGSIPQISITHLQKADAEGNWSEYEKMEHSTFEAGKYRLKVQVRINEAGNILDNSWKFIVNGIAWTTEEPINGDSFSKGWAYSPGINVEPSGVEIISSDKSGVPSPVYNLQGIKVKPDASDLRGLPAGVYIIGGKKVLLK